MIDGKSYYDILLVQPNASFDEIKKSFRTLSFKYHPDKNNGEDSKFKEINSAYETLRDKTKRNQYDFDLQMKGQNEFPNPYVSNIFSGIFGGRNNAQSAPNLNKMNHFFEASMSMDDLIAETIIQGMMGAHKDESFPFKVKKTKSENSCKETTSSFKAECSEDICIEKEIEFEESFLGCCVPITVERNVIKSEFDTSIRKESEKIYLTIPAGVDDNEIITVIGKGNVYMNSKSDVKVQIKVKSHCDFQRDGLNLVIKKTISFKESICGMTFDINHINGKQLRFSSSRGNILQNFDKKVIQGLGFNRNDKNGNLIIQFVVNHPPQKLNEEQLQFIEANF